MAERLEGPQGQLSLRPAQAHPFIPHFAFVPRTLPSCLALAGRGGEGRSSFLSV